MKFFGNYFIYNILDYNSYILLAILLNILN